MTAPHILNPVALLEKGLSEASPDLMRTLLATVINSLLSADADAVCGASPLPERSSVTSHPPRRRCRRGPR